MNTLNLNMKLLGAMTLLLTLTGFSLTSHASGGTVYCLGLEMPKRTSGEGLIEEIVDCTYRVARAKASLHGERNVTVSGYQFINSEGDTLSETEASFYRLARVTISSNKGKYTDIITLEGHTRSIPGTDDVEFYVEGLESALGIKINQ